MNVLIVGDIHGDWGGKLISLAVDHCHETGKIRGLLCSNCNHGIGKLRDSPELLRKAADYLEMHREMKL